MVKTVNSPLYDVLAAFFLIGPLVDCHTAASESVALYSASFDPPTRSQLRMLRCALGAADLPQECKEISSQISRLVILVNAAPTIEARASAKERVLMLTRALQANRPRVEISAQSPTAIEAKRRALLADGIIDKIFLLIDGDTYRQQRSTEPRSPKLIHLLFPLVGKERLNADLTTLDRSVDAKAAAIIAQLGLYREVSGDLADLQRALFDEGWRDYLSDLVTACPLAIDNNACTSLATSWSAIPTVPNPARNIAAGESATTQLGYLGTQSESRWAEKFSETTMSLVRSPADRDLLKPIAEDLAERTLRDLPRGKLPHLHRVVTPRHAAKANALRVSHSPIACAAPEDSYNADMDQYLADRFPQAFSRFLKHDYRMHSNQAVDLYLHDHPLEQAYDLHRRDGFNDFYFIQTRRGQLHRDIHLAVKAQPRAYRVVLTGVRGTDRRANVLCQLARSGIFSTHRWVQAPRPQPLFELNGQGKSLKLNPDDWLLFGFRAEWRRKLLGENWRATPLNETGLDIDLYIHPQSKRKFVTARNVYGDDAEIVLRTLYGKGMRQAIYLGTAGAVKDYRVGDVVIPNEFVDRNLNSTPFHSNLAQAYLTPLAGDVTVHGPLKHAWAQTMFEETKPLLLKWKVLGVGAVDIEGIYLGKFAQRRKNLKIAALFIISDQTLGENTIEDSNANRGAIDASVTKLMAHLYPKIFNLR